MRYLKGDFLSVVSGIGGITIIILAVDPGKTTGVVLYDVQTDEVVMHDEVDFNQLGELLQGMDLPDVVVVESFNLSPAKFGFGGSGVEYKSPLEVIGAVRMWFGLHGVEVVLQSPACLQSKSKKRQAKEYLEGPHARSAMVHILYYLQQRQ